LLQVRIVAQTLLYNVSFASLLDYGSHLTHSFNQSHSKDFRQKY
jgi:hypothetical protein